jgi:hypothetical protein
MPTATLKVMSTNNLEVSFNDTLDLVSITNVDIYIAIYGSETSYTFTWSAYFLDAKTVIVNMQISSYISGSNEKVYVEFPPSTNLKSSYSHRKVSPDIQLTGSLNSQDSSAAASSLGQTALYIYLGSIGLTIISSFGGNSMEMMWMLTNTLQLMYYISVINVHFPDTLESFFPFLKASNADNPYFKYLTYLIIPQSEFTRGEVNSKIGPMAFWVSSSDKLPILFPILFAFLAIKIVDMLVGENALGWAKYIFKINNYLKYDFFIRITMELMVEITFTSLVNIYFVRNEIEKNINFAIWQFVENLMILIIFKFSKIAAM